MSVVLATWNPARYPELETSWESEGEIIRKEGSFTSRWSTGPRKGGIKRGDDVLLVRQNRDRGIVRSGKAVSEVFNDLHWQEEKAQRGDFSSYINIEWTHQVFKPSNRLPIELLEVAVPEVKWNSLMGSGVIVHDNRAAKALLQLWTYHIGPERLELDWDEEEAEFEELHQEGGLKLRIHRRRERDRKLRDKKIASVINAHGIVKCEACGEDLRDKYGDRSAKIFECHHVMPLSVTGETHTSLSDLAVLCPNCHRVAHVINPWPTLEQLREQVQSK